MLLFRELHHLTSTLAKITRDGSIPIRERCFATVGATVCSHPSPMPPSYLLRDYKSCAFFHLACPFCHFFIALFFCSAYGTFCKGTGRADSEGSSYLPDGRAAPEKHRNHSTSIYEITDLCDL